MRPTFDPCSFHEKDSRFSPGCPPNDSTFSRKPREPNAASLHHRRARLGGVVMMGLILHSGTFSSKRTHYS